MPKFTPIEAIVSRQWSDKNGDVIGVTRVDVKGLLDGENPVESIQQGIDMLDKLKVSAPAFPKQEQPAPEPAKPEKGDITPMQLKMLKQVHSEACAGEHPERIKIISDKLKEFGVEQFEHPFELLSKVQASNILTACGIKGRGRA